MNNDKNIQPRNRAKGNKDPLKGAPGHMEVQASEDVADENERASIPKNIDEAMELIGTTFGHANVKKFRELLSNNAANAEAKVKDLIGALSNRPMASAAAVATGVGAIFLLREYLTRDSAPKKKVAGSERNPSSTRAKSSSKVKGSAKKGKKSK